MPKNITQFPPIVQAALRIYNKLPDTHIPLGMEGSICSGKDYSNLLNICKLYNIDDDYDIMIVLNVCEHLENKMVAKEQASLKKLRAK